MLIKRVIRKIRSMVNRTLQIRKRREAIQQGGTRMIGRITEALDRQGAFFFVDYGTLLGITREKGLIAWDDDIDFGIRIDDHFGWGNLEQAMESIGFKKNHQFTLDNEITEQNYSYDKYFVDFFRHTEIDGDSVSYVYDKKKGQDYPAQNAWDVMEFRTPSVLDRKAITAGDDIVYVPSNTEDYLACVYGPGWRVPDPSWKTGSGPATTWIKDKYGYMETFK